MGDLRLADRRRKGAGGDQGQALKDFLRGSQTQDGPSEGLLQPTADVIPHGGRAEAVELDPVTGLQQKPLLGTNRRSRRQEPVLLKGAQEAGRRLPPVQREVVMIKEEDPHEHGWSLLSAALGLRHSPPPSGRFRIQEDIGHDKIWTLRFEHELGHR